MAAARIILKPFEFENGQPTMWRAEPDFIYPGMPSLHPRKVHYGVNTTPIYAILDLAAHLPAQVDWRDKLYDLTDDAIYIYPCQLWSTWRCVQLDGKKPTSEEWLAERQMWNLRHRDEELAKWAERKAQSVRIMARIADDNDKRLAKLKTL